MRALVLALALSWAAPSIGVAQDTSVWTPGARASHERASRLYLLWIGARHDLARTGTQRRCFDRVATRAGAAVRELEHRAAVGWIPDGSLRDIGARLDALSEIATEVCHRTRDEEGVVQVDVSRSPWMPWMPRDGALILRVGARYELAPRVQGGGYGPEHTFPAEVSLGGFVLPWLRVEGLASFGYQPVYGPHGSLGARAVATAPWAIVRLGVGLGASVMMAMDRVGRGSFGWLGFQLELPVELGFELSDSVALTLVGGPIYTQAGELRPDARAIGLSGGMLLEVVP